MAVGCAFVSMVNDYKINNTKMHKYTHLVATGDDDLMYVKCVNGRALSLNTVVVGMMR